MASTRSDRACKLCRQRRVKCDKTLPTCQRCNKLGQTCPGYPTRQKWFDQSRQVRERLAHDRALSSSTTPSQSAGTTSLSSPETGLSNYQFEADSISQQNSVRTTPGQRLTTLGERSEPFEANSITSDTTSGPTSSTDFTSVPVSAYSAAHLLTENSTTPGDERITGPAPPYFNEYSESDFFDLDIENYYANGNNACGFFPGVAAIQPGTEDAEMYSDTQPSSVLESGRPDTNDTDAVREKDDASQEHEVALLMRLFVDVLAPWMDVFDMDAYFTRILPTKATFDVLLRSAVAAVAAKQTARYVFSQKTTACSKHYAFVLGMYQNASPGEWFYKAASYYDRGISYLRTRLQRCTSSDGKYPVSALTCNASPSSRVLDAAPRSLAPSHSPEQDAIDPNLQSLLSAISVFSLYETLDDCQSSSSQHLPGFLALMQRSTSSSPSQPMAKIMLRDSGDRAAFWYFARKELLSSYANHTMTRLDPNNIAPWISSGLPIEAYHMLLSDSEARDNIAIRPWHNSTEGQECASYVLIWLATHVVNIFALDSQQNNGHHPRIQMTEHRQDLSSLWESLRYMLSWWYNNRPQVFRPYAMTDIKPAGRKQETTLKAKFLTCSMGAAALQLYHFVQILLLLNLPHKASTGENLAHRLRMLKRNSDEVEYHSREICAIAFGLPPFAIQRQMSHPLQLAGAYFDAQEDRNAILELLKGVVTETSSPAEDVVQVLLMQWEQNDRG